MKAFSLPFNIISEVEVPNQVPPARAHIKCPPLCLSVMIGDSCGPSGLRSVPGADPLLGITTSAQPGDMNPSSAPIQTMIKYLHRGH